MLEDEKHITKISRRIDTFNVNIFGWVFLLKIFILATIIIADTQMVRTIRVYVMVSFSEY